MNDIASPISNLLLLAQHTTIVHHIPGRIRLRISLAGAAIAAGIDLDELGSRVPGIRGIRVNALVGSVVIEYDRHRLPPDLWEDLAGISGNPEAACEIEERLALLRQS
ncbi:MAG: HMA2 domain-containing protein [Syntrophobacteraceae bacterium]